MYDSSQIDTKILFIKVIFRKVTPKPLITQTRHAFFAPHPILCDFPDCRCDDEIDTIGTIGTTEPLHAWMKKAGETDVPPAELFQG
jgi:hypothetical protein